MDKAERQALSWRNYDKSKPVVLKRGSIVVIADSEQEAERRMRRILASKLK